MQTTAIKTLYHSYEPLIGSQIIVNGWIRSLRDSKTFGFIELNDGSHLKNLQVVFESDLENFEEITKFSTGSSIQVQGELIKSEGAKQAFELKASKVTLIGAADESFPLQKKRHSFEYLRTIAHLRPRTNTFSAVFRVRSLLSFAIHQFFNERGFIWAHTPIITASDAEGAGEMFQVTTLDLDNPPKNEEGKTDFSKDFYGKKAGLTVSGQLEGETFATAFGKIYTFGPTFRAENSNTTRHLSEFRMIEPEIAFADLEDNMQLAEDMIKYVFSYVLENAPAEMDFFNQFILPGVKERAEKLVNSSFAKVSYTEAVKMLQESGQKFEYAPEWGIDLQTEHERYLSEKIFNGPVFITDYPKDIKAFYMKLNEDGKTVRAMDMLVPGIGELIGGSQREDDFKKLETRMQEMDLNTEDYSWYLDLRKYGSVPHAGFGVGFERLVMYITGMENIRDVIPFPRTPKNCEF
ncbi:MAG: asparagine--tRNA ligase [bacterium]|nr:asparagine--tRNA ligase [bacterium]